MNTKVASEKAVNQALDTLLGKVWAPPADLAAHSDQCFRRRHDDTDGQTGWDQDIALGFTPDGDAWIILGGAQSLRFRCPLSGGGASPAVHRTLWVLAEAIRRDNLARPQREA